MKLVAFIVDRLQHPSARWAVIAVALCLTLPSLLVGFATDDHNWRAVFQGYPGMEEVEQAPWDAFRFHFSEDDAIRQDRMDRGLLPWWSGEQTHTAFMRPLSSLSHWLDYTLFGDTAWPMHVHNMTLFGLLLLLVAALYRHLIDVRHVALLALLLYAIDDARGIPVGWLSARNSLLTAIFGVTVLLSHDQFRRHGRRWGLPVALLALCIGLLCGEATVSIGGYLFAYALFVDPKGFGRGFLSLLPYGAVVVLWRVIYQHLGYGAFGSGAYVDPTNEPLLFAYRIAERLPVLFFGAFGLPDSTFYNFLPTPWSGVYFGVALVFLAIVLLALWPLLRRDARARENEGNPHAVVIHILFAQQAMVTGGEAMIRRENDARVVRLAAFFQGIENAPNLGIHVGDYGVILLAVDFHRVGRAGKGRQIFITESGTTAHGLVMGMSADEVFGHANRFERVLVYKFLGRLTGIVGRVEGEVHEEGPVGLGGLAEEIHAVVTEYFAPVLAPGPEAPLRCVPRLPIVGLPFQRSVVAQLGRAIVVPGHPAAHMTDVVEDIDGVDALHMPLARHVGVITAIVEKL